ADNSNPLSTFDIPGMPGSSMGMINISDILGKGFGAKSKRKKMSVEEAYDVLMAEESDKLVDEEKLIKEAVEATENNGMVFIDEIDKIASRNDVRGGEVSR